MAIPADKSWLLKTPVLLRDHVSQSQTIAALHLSKTNLRSKVIAMVKGRKTGPWTTRPQTSGPWNNGKRTISDSTLTCGKVQSTKAQFVKKVPSFKYECKPMTEGLKVRVPIVQGPIVTHIWYSAPIGVSTLYSRHP